jgi:hypothetical protein
VTKRSGPSLWLQKLIAGNQGIASSGIQSNKTIPLQRHIYFKIDIFHENDQCQIFQCGRNYQVVISTAYERSHDGLCEPVSLPIQSNIKLELLYSTELGIETHTCSLPSKLIVPFKHSFAISVPERHPTCDVKLVLRGYIKETEPPKTLAMLSIRMEGTHSSDDERWQSLCDVDISSSPPKYAAILYVTGSRSEEVNLEGWYDRKLIKICWPEWNAISLAECIKKQEPPNSIIMKLRKFSRKGPAEIHKWLKYLIDNFSTELCVIIVDTTSEIPWEMFQVKSNSGDEIYLGAKARVVRWTKIQDYGDVHLMQLQDICYQGSVLAYINDKALGTKQTSAEWEALESLKVMPYTNIQQFKTHLSTRESFEHIGLIYIADHGYDGTNIGSGSSSNDRITSIDLERLRMQQRHARPLVFANLCESARLVRSKNGFSDGLLEVLLARCASGYIGTLAKVGSFHASNIAQRLLQAAYTNQKGVQIAEFLRELRDEAAKKINESTTQHIDKAEEFFIYTFTYVYYGNPLTKLLLFAENDAEADV